MDAIDLIKLDHRHIEELVHKFLETESGMTQEELYQSVQTELTAHTDMEEQILYPAVEQFAPDQVARALKEHSEVKQILAELLNSDLNEQGFETRFEKLIDDVAHHVQEEESATGILEIARQRLAADTLAQMRKAILRIKRRTERDLAA
jgi:hemerythrin superfamily protein